MVPWFPIACNESLGTCKESMSRRRRSRVLHLTAWPSCEWLSCLKHGTVAPAEALPDKCRTAPRKPLASLFRAVRGARLRLRAQNAMTSVVRCRASFALERHQAPRGLNFDVRSVGVCEVVRDVRGGPILDMSPLPARRRRQRHSIRAAAGSVLRRLLRAHYLPTRCGRSFSFSAHM
jgi:hypothetical protein